MTKHTAAAKLERIVEAVRKGLEGDLAVEFIRNNGYALSSTGLARHLRSMGGRGRVQALLAEGKSNAEVLQVVLPEVEVSDLPVSAPSQAELFVDLSHVNSLHALDDRTQPSFESTKMTVRLPSDVYEAIRIASKAEDKTLNELVVEILTTALSQMPHGFSIHPE